MLFRSDDYGDPTKMNKFRPIWYLTNEDKREYEEIFGIVHSRCYTEYGLKRTGCVGCPFNRNVNAELEIIKRFEPKLYAACIKIFGGGMTPRRDTENSPPSRMLSKSVTKTKFILTKN